MKENDAAIAAQSQRKEVALWEATVQWRPKKRRE